MRQSIWFRVLCQKSVLLCLILGFITASEAQSTAQSDTSKKSDGPKIPIKSLKSWIVDLKSPDASVRDYALVAIPNYGSSTSEAVPAVIGSCLDPDAGCRVKAILALSVLEILDKDVQRTVDALARRAQEDPQAQVRFLAISALQRFDPIDGKKTISALVEASKYANSYEVRKSAILALVKFGMDKNLGPDVKAVSAALNALKDPAVPVRYAAITSIALLGKPNNQIVSAAVDKALMDLSTGNDKIFAIWAKVGLANQDVLTVSYQMEFISRMLKQGDNGVKLEALYAVSVMGVQAKVLVGELIDVLEDKEPLIVFNACISLASIGVDARKAVEPLTKLAAAKETIEPVKNAANVALNAIKGMNVTPPAGAPKKP